MSSIINAIYRAQTSQYAAYAPKYADIASTHTFVPVAVESMGPLGQEASEFLTKLGRRLSLITDDARETSYLFQRVSVLIQRYNAVGCGISGLIRRGRR